MVMAVRALNRFISNYIFFAVFSKYCARKALFPDIRKSMADRILC